MPSVGGAFVSGFQESLMQRAAQKRADLEMELNLKREERMARAQLEDEAERKRAHLEHEVEQREEHARRVQETAEKVEGEKEKRHQQRKAGLVPGDVVDAEFIKNEQKYGNPGAVRLGVQASIPAATMAGQPTGQPSETMQGPSTFKGSSAQQQAIRIGGMAPGSPEQRSALIAAAVARGENPNAAELNPPKSTDNMEDVYRQNPRTGQVEKVGSVPKGSHFMTEPQPKDTSARDAAAEQRKSSHRDQVYEKEKGSLDKLTSEAENHLKGINDLGLALNEMTPQADTLVAPLVLKATISGTGSGFRMTRAEIENVVGGRSAWENLNAKLMHWSTDTSKALSITDDQRKQLRSLAKAIRKKSRSTIEKANRYRDQMVEANDPKDIERLGNKAHQSLFVDDEPEADTGGVPQVGGTFQGGKVLKVTPVK